MSSLYLLKNLPKMEAYLEKLGQIHCTAGMPKRHLDIMGPLFCQAIRPILEVCMFSRSGINGNNNKILETRS